MFLVTQSAVARFRVFGRQDFREIHFVVVRDVFVVIVHVHVAQVSVFVEGGVIVGQIVFAIAVVHGKIERSSFLFFRCFRGIAWLRGRCWYCRLENNLRLVFLYHA